MANQQNLLSGTHRLPRGLGTPIAVGNCPHLQIISHDQPSIAQRLFEQTGHNIPIQTGRARTLSPRGKLGMAHHNRIAPLTHLTKNGKLLLHLGPCPIHQRQISMRIQPTKCISRKMLSRSLHPLLLHSPQKLPRPPNYLFRVFPKATSRQ